MKRLLPSGSRAGGARRVLVASVVLAAVALASALGLLDPVSLLITVGGTLAVVAVTYPRRRLAACWQRVVRLVRDDAGDDGADVEATIAALKRLARVHRTEGAPALERAARAERDPFLRDAIERALECEDADELRDALLGEARRAAAEGEGAREVLSTLGKLFPAFGLIGTLVGLALLLPRVGSGDVVAAGPSLGICILTTLYGAVLANVVVLPLATRLHSAQARRWLVLQTIVLGAELVQRREYPTRVERALRSFAGLAPLAPGRDVTLLTDRAA